MHISWMTLSIVLVETNVLLCSAQFGCISILWTGIVGQGTFYLFLNFICKLEIRLYKNNV